MENGNDKTEVMRKLTDIYFLDGELTKSEKLLDIYLSRKTDDYDYILLKAFIMNLRNEENGKFLTKS